MRFVVPDELLHLVLVLVKAREVVLDLDGDVSGLEHLEVVVTVSDGQDASVGYAVNHLDDLALLYGSHVVAHQGLAEVQQETEVRVEVFVVVYELETLPIEVDVIGIEF
jgi:hypothetical protein